MRLPISNALRANMGLHPRVVRPRRRLSARTTFSVALTVGSSLANDVIRRGEPATAESKGDCVSGFKGIICGDISEFESYMLSHAVRSL